jgi:hypothetical protein
MGGLAGNIHYRRQGSQVHLGTLAPPLQCSTDSRSGIKEDTIALSSSQSCYEALRLCLTKTVAVRFGSNKSKFHSKGD